LGVLLVRVDHHHDQACALQFSSDAPYLITSITFVDDEHYAIQEDRARRRRRCCRQTDPRGSSHYPTSQSNLIHLDTLYNTIGSACDWHCGSPRPHPPRLLLLVPLPSKSQSRARRPHRRQRRLRRPKEARHRGAHLRGRIRGVRIAARPYRCGKAGRRRAAVCAL